MIRDDASSAVGLEIDVVAARQGDRDAFERLVNSCCNMVSSIAFAIVRNVDASEEVSQEVFLAAWAGLRKLRNPASFLPWLRQMTRNQAHNWVRHQRRTRERFHQPEDELLAQVVDTSLNPPEAIVRLEEIDLVAQLMEELPQDAREVISLYYREGRSIQQVSDLLGLRPETVKKRLSRARQKIRHEMLSRAGEILQRTAPGAGFTSSILAALSTTSSPSSAATAASLAAASGASGSNLAAMLGPVLLPATGATAAIEVGVRSYLKLARDAEERRQIRAWRWINVLFVFVFAAALPASWNVFEHWLAPATVYATLMLFLGASIFFWLSRITERRLAAERLEDPTAGERQRRENRIGLLCWLLGTLTGALGLAIGIMKSAP